MVKEHNEKSAFKKALVATIILFFVGVSLGVFIEAWRSQTVRDQYEELEFELLDAKLRTDFYRLMEQDFCEIAIEDNLKFSDRIYEEGKKIDIYEKFNRLGDRLFDEKRKYTLLKTEFWLNSILLRDKCEAEYSTVIYFYNDVPTSDEEKQKINVQSKVLEDLKEKYGADIMLIPLPIDLGASVVDSFVLFHNIDEVPTILINEEIKLEGLHDLADIEKLI
jgi:hypothetical protein